MNKAQRTIFTAIVVILSTRLSKQAAKSFSEIHGTHEKEYDKQQIIVSLSLVRTMK